MSGFVSAGVSQRKCCGSAVVVGEDDVAGRSVDARAGRRRVGGMHVAIRATARRSVEGLNGI
jgi:hypothetical protein